MTEFLEYALFLLLPLASAVALLLIACRIRRLPGPLGWRRLVLGNLLILILLLSVLFIAGETYYRFFYDTTDAVNFTRASRRWAQRFWHLNSLQCRDDREYLYQLTPGKRRISFIGDSFTTGHGIKRIEDRFANRVRSAHPEWEIHVLARNGLDTGGELLGLRYLLDKGYQLDEVVLVYCLNDVSDMMPEQEQAANRLEAELGHRGWLRNHSYLADIVYHRYRVARDPYLKNYFSFVRDAYQGPLWEKQKERLKELRDLIQTHGGHLAVVTFPFLHALGPEYSYQFVHDRLGRLWQDLNVPHLDLLTVFKTEAPRRLMVNPYDPHPNEYASRLAADAIDKFLRARLPVNAGK